MFVIWISVHRSLLFAIVCFSLWGGAQWWYLRYDIRNYLNSRKPHNWSVDMEAKTGKGGRVKSKH